MSLPNLLSAFRIALVPALLASAWWGQTTLFLALLAAAFASDAVDGFAARSLGQTSEFGARLDSAGDWLLYAALPPCALWLWPETVSREIGWIGVGIAMLLIPSAVGLLKFGRLTSYHTYLAKLTGVVMAAGALVLFVWNEAALFHVAIVLLVIEGIEELLITAELPEWHADVRTFRCAQHLREAAI